MKFRQALTWCLARLLGFKCYVDKYGMHLIIIREHPIICNAIFIEDL